MTAVFDMDPQAVQEVLGAHRRFVSPFADPPGYSLLAEEGTTVDEAAVAGYLDRLREAVKNADALIAGAFRREFYDFYGVDRDKVRSPEEMCRRLIFDSFVLDRESGNADACLTNNSFLFGHFIDCRWDRDWGLVHSFIC